MLINSGSTMNENLDCMQYKRQNIKFNNTLCKLYAKRNGFKEFRLQERESRRGVNVKETIQLASSGDGVFSGSCDSGQNKGRLDSAALLWIVSTV